MPDKARKNVSPKSFEPDEAYIRELAAKLTDDRESPSAKDNNYEIDDEEIDEDEAFDEEDRKKYGNLSRIPPGKPRPALSSRSGRLKGRLVDRDDEESGGLSDSSGAEEDTDNDDEDEEQDDEADDVSESGDDELPSVGRAGAAHLRRGSSDDNLEDDGESQSSGNVSKEDGEADEDGKEDEDEDQGQEVEVSLADIFDTQAQAERDRAKAAAATAVASTKRKRSASGDQLLDDGVGDGEDSDEDDGEDEEEDAVADLSTQQQAQLLKLMHELEGSAAAASASSTGATNAAGKPSAKRQRVRVAEPDVSAEHEYAADAAGAAAGTAAAASSSEVNLAALMGSLSGSAAFGSLKQRLSRLVAASDKSEAGVRGKGKAAKSRGPAPLAAPPSRAVAERATRAEAYDSASRHVTRWQAVVQINRRAPHLSFSAEAAQDTRPAQTLSALADKFTPASEFEAAVAEALASSGMGALPKGVPVAGAKKQGDLGVLEAEEAEAQAAAASEAAAAAAGLALPDAGLTAAQLKARHDQLAKLRALVFYEEQRRRRQNAIKSKAYRRLRARADAKQGGKERAALDPDAAAALEAEEARLLAKERMTLRHRVGKGIGGSKWVKRVLARGGGGGGAMMEAGGGGGSGTKAALLETLRRSEELAARMRGAKAAAAADAADADNDVDYDSADDAPTVLRKARDRLQQEAADAAAADDALPTKGLYSMKFMRAAADREREQAQAEALAAAAQLDADAAALEAGGRSAGGKRKRPAGEWDNISVPDEEDDEAAADRQRHKEMGLPDEQDQDDGDNDDDNDALQRRKPNVPSTSKAHTSVASAAAAAGRRQFGGTAVQAPAKAAASKGAPKEGSSFRVGTQAAVDVTLSTLSGSREAVAKGAGGSGSAWLTQGGVTFAAPNNSTATAAGEAGASSEPVNPWLDNPFDSSAGGAAAQTGAGRVKASQRAKASADTDRGTSQFILDVAGSIANLGGAPFAPAAAAPIPSKKQQKQKNKAAMDTPTKVASASATEPLVSTGVAPSDKRRIGTVSNRPNAAAREPELVIEQPDPAAAAAAAALADQAELIRRAFAGYGTTEDDLAADRLADAEEAAAEAAGVTTGAAKRAAAAAEVASKPGWGSWTGAGAETSPAAEQHHQQSSRNKKKNHKRLNLGGAPGLSSSLARTVAVVGTNTSPATTTARKDAKLSRVVITEKRDKKLAKHQAAAVPYPFTSAETYERSLLHPLGDAWNTLGATAEMTKPDWVTRAGLIIQPISQYKVKRGEGPDAAVASSAAASLPQIHTKRNMPGQAKATVLANRQKSKQRKS